LSDISCRTLHIIVKASSLQLVACSQHPACWHDFENNKRIKIERMALQIVVDYHNQPVTFNVFSDEKNIYRLCLEENPLLTDVFIPNKINIRRKGKIWISDVEDHALLVKALTKEITRFSND
jgi:hypothetical protein